jgi:hypothetical protein
MPILSKTIIFLMGLRLVLNQFRDLTFFAIGQYNVSILTIWSAVFTTLVIVRLMAPPPLRKDLKVVVIVLIFYMTVFGITRVFAPAEIITSYLYTLQFSFGCGQGTG